MDLSGASLSDLVAELRERLRRFASGPPREDEAEVAGPLTAAGRAALAARLLAVVLESRRGPEAREAARALEELAAALAAAPSPLPGSAWEGDLASLTRTLESIAGAWDEVEDEQLGGLWLALRAAGDRLWAPSAAGPRRRPEGPVELWLLVAGTLRRDSLRRRLTAAGVRVRCLEGVDATLAALADTMPTAIVSDDAAPARFRSRLLPRLPSPAPPVVLVRSRGGVTGAGDLLWLPPHDPRELLAMLGR